MLGIDLKFSFVPHFETVTWMDLEFVRMYKVEYIFCDVCVATNIIHVINTHEITEILEKAMRGINIKVQQFKSLYSYNEEMIEVYGKGINKRSKFIRQNFMKFAAHSSVPKTSQKQLLETYKRVSKSGLKDGQKTVLAIIHPIQIEESIKEKSRDLINDEALFALQSVLLADPANDKVLVIETENRALQLQYN